MTTSPNLIVEQAILEGAAHRKAGRLAQAQACYLDALAVEAMHPELNYQLGMLFMQMMQPGASLHYFMAALEADPACEKYWLSYIAALTEAGQSDAAQEVIAMARQQGMQCVEMQSEQIEPDEAQIHELACLFADGRHQEAERRAASLTMKYPGYGFGWKVLGAVTRNNTLALNAMQKAASLLPEDFEVHYNLGLILQDLGRSVDACASYHRALQINSDYAQGHNNLGVALQGEGLLEEACASYRRAIEIDSGYVNAHHNLGIVLQALNRPHDAEAVHRKTLLLKPDHADAYCNLGTTLLSMGRLEEAAESYRQALQFRPDFVVAHSNLIFCLDMADSTSSTEFQAERTRWAEAHAAPLWQDTIHSNEPSADRRLRIGYVSADFRDHSAPKAFGGMLTDYDRSKFEVFAYSNYKGRDDRYTALFKQNVTAWRNIAGISDEAAASMIRDDKIDILVDLSGHSAGNRLLVFARRPAPLQITAWGYAAGTGLRAMDVFFADTVMAPLHEQHHYAEKIVYLHCALGSFFIDQFPDVNELPARQDGIVTFASFNRLAKVSDKAYQAWADILRETPGSRLLLKTAELNDSSIQHRVAEFFSRAGIEPGRIVMRGRTSWYEHMQAYQQVDIALDSFPQGGGITALEGLMMGVPMVTLHGPTIIGRLSASILTTLNLADWIAASSGQYVELAVQKSRDLQSLSELRGRLRGIFTSSVIGDRAAYVRDVEREYRQLWQAWCARILVRSDVGENKLNAQSA